ncbi:MAG: YbaN family protein [Bacteroidales bacterium]|nr:YbaN family protein [Bacteroidales bacterium]MDD2425108.1 YbaN family protein [Bacteroidales bacterium]MDD3988611.1 YbaN family protein [Bacteroidales bacterium]
MKKYIFLVTATICVALGAIGIFVPLLPTTPFLLLAVILYMNSSHRMLRWLMQNRYLSPYIRDYFSGKGIPLRLKIKTLSLLWITLGLSSIFATEKLWVRLVLAGIGTGVTIHLLMKKTRRDGA